MQHVLVCKPCLCQKNLVLTPSKNVTITRPQDRTSLPTTNHNNIFIVFPSLSLFPPLNLTRYSPLLHHSTQSLFPRCSTVEGCLRWREARTNLGILGYACETTLSSWQQQDLLHFEGLIYMCSEKHLPLVGHQPIRKWYRSCYGGYPINAVNLPFVATSRVSSGRLLPTSFSDTTSTL